MKFRIIALAMLLTLTASFSLSQARSMVVKVPFEFQAGTKQLPAGNYTVSLLDERTVSLRNTDTRDRLILLTDSKEKLEPASVGKLVFNRYGETHFLAEVWRQGFETGRVVHRSNAEARLARRASPKNTIILASR